MKKIRMLMIETGITAQELANKMGLSHQAVLSRIRGAKSISVEEAKKMMQIFNRTFEQIFLD